MKYKIICLTDYKGFFGSKWMDKPYRSGMDKELLKKYFAENDIDLTFQKINEVNLDSPEVKDSIFIYTSSEDIGYHYKSFIEDIVLGLQEAGAKVIPEFKFLRATNNKVFMEAIRKSHLNNIRNLKSSFYGSLEEVDFSKITFPIVFKSSGGSMSQGVDLAKTQKELSRIIKKRCRSKDLRNDIRDVLRSFKRDGYIRESLYRNKFILQEYLPNLSYDFKILIFGDMYYIFRRLVRKDDFRASGSGFKKYIYGSNVQYPSGIFDFAYNIFEQLKVPHLSLDIAYDGSNFYLIEFQTLYFGTVGHHESDGYYYRSEGNWLFDKKWFDLEKVYADSIFKYIQNT